MEGSSKKKRAANGQRPQHTQPTQSVINVPNQTQKYRQFDAISTTMRAGLLKSCAESLIKNKASNGGKCKRGFVKQLVDSANEKAPGLDITRNDINNEERRLASTKRKRESRESIPAIDSNASTSESNGPCIASVSLPVPPIIRPTSSSLAGSSLSNESSPPSICQPINNASSSRLIVTSNICSYAWCPGPDHIVPEICQN